MTVLYHCVGDPKEDTKTLCGRERRRIAELFHTWDKPIHFVRCDEWDKYGDKYCKKCLNHPDLPLLVLKHLEESNEL